MQCTSLTRYVAIHQFTPFLVIDEAKNSAKCNNGFRLTKRIRKKMSKKLKLQPQKSLPYLLFQANKPHTGCLKKSFSQTREPSSLRKALLNNFFLFNKPNCFKNLLTNHAEEKPFSSLLLQRATGVLFLGHPTEQKIFDGITTAWSDKRQPIQHRLHFKKQV